MSAALDEEEPLFYESDVLVVMREGMSAWSRRCWKREVERKSSEKNTISPLITTPDDPAVEAFIEKAGLGRGFERREGR